MNKVILRTLVLVIGLSILAGCSTVGNESLSNESPESIGRKIHEGLTTKQQLISMLGAPMETTFTDGGLEVMTYEYIRLMPRAQNFIPYNIISQVSDGKKKELVILLDENSLVKKLVMNVTDTQKRWGVIE
ncbi:MAG TPA: hypothetical protein ENI05_00250 [Porticoccus sp.]|nr:hypothetical protein [Porticoccus sp.]